MIERDYLTFDELMDRWSCDAKDIHYLIANSDLAPSIAWAEGALECQWEPGGGAEMGLILAAMKTEDRNFAQTNVVGWVYLRLPTILGPFRYSFSYATKTLCAPSEFSNDLWYRLNESIWDAHAAELGPEWIESNAVFMNVAIEGTETILRPDLGERRAQKILERSSGKPEKPTVSVSDNTLVATIAALLACWPGGKTPSGKDLERAASAIGVSVSDDSIRKALTLAKQIAPSLKTA